MGAGPQDSKEGEQDGASVRTILVLVGTYMTGEQKKERN